MKKRITYLIHSVSITLHRLRQNSASLLSPVASTADADRASRVLFRGHVATVLPCHAVRLHGAQTGA